MGSRQIWHGGTVEQIADAMRRKNGARESAARALALGMIRDTARVPHTDRQRLQWIDRVIAAYDIVTEEIRAAEDARYPDTRSSVRNAVWDAVQSNVRDETGAP